MYKATFSLQASLATLLLFCAFGSVQAADSTSRSSGVAELIKSIKSEPRRNARYELASDLPDVVEHEQNAGALDPTTVDQIATLLDDPWDGVRAFAALALGKVGQPASRATPLLIKALKRGEAEMLRPGELGPSYFSGDAICEAFEQIGSTPPDAPCMYGLYGR